MIMRISACTCNMALAPAVAGLMSPNSFIQAATYTPIMAIHADATEMQSKFKLNSPRRIVTLLNTEMGIYMNPRIPQHQI